MYDLEVGYRAAAALQALALRTGQIVDVTGLGTFWMRDGATAPSLSFRADDALQDALNPV